jgi:hypothetical protein
MNDVKHSKATSIARLPDVSVLLLWDDDESSDLNIDDLGAAMQTAAPYARARRLQVALAEAQAGGMPPQVLVAVLADWACVALQYRSEPGLQAAIEVGRLLAAEGCTPETEATVERFDETFGAMAAKGRTLLGMQMIIEAFDQFTGAPVTTKSQGIARSGHVWFHALAVLEGVAEAAGEHAVTALGECARLMSQRIYAWPSPAMAENSNR